MELENRKLDVAKEIADKKAEVDKIKARNKPKSTTKK